MNLYSTNSLRRFENHWLLKIGEVAPPLRHELRRPRKALTETGETEETQRGRERKRQEKIYKMKDPSGYDANCGSETPIQAPRDARKNLKQGREVCTSLSCGP